MQRPATWNTPIAVLFTTELVIALLVIFTAIGLIVPTYRIATFKGKSTELLQRLGVQRIRMVEHYALNGEWLGPDPESRNIEEELSGRSYSKNMRLEFTSGAVVATGTLRGFGELPFRVSLRPAVADDGYHQTVIWLCGNEATPPGFVSPAPPLPYGLPSTFSVLPCSEGLRR